MQLLVTTRRANVASTAGGKVIDVDTVDDETARRMLAFAAGCEAGTLPPEAKGLLSACNGLPLALAMAGALIKSGADWSTAVAEYGRLHMTSSRMMMPSCIQTRGILTGRCKRWSR